MVLEDRQLSTGDGILAEWGWPNLYFLTGEVPLILVLYVDDLFLIGYERLIGDCKSNLAVDFEMKDLVLMHYFLGLGVWKRDWCFFIRQGKYAVEILKRFRMEECKPMAIPIVSNWKKINALGLDEFDPTLYCHLNGSLMSLVNTQPDINFAVNYLS